MLGDEACVHIAVHKVLNLQDHLMVLGCRGHSRDDQLIERALHARDRLCAVLSPHYELSQEGVIVWWHLGDAQNREYMVHSMQQLLWSDALMHAKCKKQTLQA